MLNQPLFSKKLSLPTLHKLISYRVFYTYISLHTFAHMLRILVSILLMFNYNKKLFIIDSIKPFFNAQSIE